MKNILIAALGLSLFGTAHAADLTFNNLAVGYNQLDFDCSSNCDGVFVAGSAEINPLIFVAASYADFGPASSSSASVGFRSSSSAVVSIYGQIGIGYVDAGRFGSDTNAFGAVGVRGMLTPSFELDGSVAYVNVDGADPSANLTGTFFFTDTVGLGLSLGAGDGFFGGGANLRVNF